MQGDLDQRCPHVAFGPFSCGWHHLNITVAKRAFDLVDHSILLNKLALYKLNPSAIQWFKSYLCSRQQVIESDKGLTDFTTVQSDVPQGSILGPTLFLIFINDLPPHIKKSSSDLYADDTTIHTHGNDIDAIEEDLNI